MMGVWYDGWCSPAWATDVEFSKDYNAAALEEQFRSYAFWLGAEGENI